MSSHRKPRLGVARKQARAITLCAAALGSAAAPAIASAATAGQTSAHAAVRPAVTESSLARTIAVSAQNAVTQSVTTQDVAVATDASSTTSTNTYTVQAGDTLFGIASRSLGSGNLYPEIFKLNRGHVENNGATFKRAGLIDVGWTITLPAGSASAVAPVTTTPSTDNAPAATAPAASSSSSSDSSSGSASGSASDSSSSSSSSSSSDSSSSSSSSSDSSSSGYADDLDGWINQAISILNANGYSVSYNAIYQTAMNESSGDENAVNGWDSNAANGTPSIGLMQVIQPTFDAYALPGYDDIYNPVDNIIAAAIYAQDTYGGLDNVVDARCGGSCWYGY